MTANLFSTSLLSQAFPFDLCMLTGRRSRQSFYFWDIPGDGAGFRKYREYYGADE